MITPIIADIKVVEGERRFVKDSIDLTTVSVFVKHQSSVS